MIHLRAFGEVASGWRWQHEEERRRVDLGDRVLVEGETWELHLPGGGLSLEVLDGQATIWSVGEASGQKLLFWRDRWDLQPGDTLCLFVDDLPPEMPWKVTVTSAERASRPRTPRASVTWGQPGAQRTVPPWVA